MKLGEQADARQIAEYAFSQPDRLRIGIDGPGGSGKSVLAADLARRLRSGAILVHGDEFLRPMSDPARSEDRIAGLYDLSRLEREVLEPHRHGTEIRYQRYDWDQDQLVEWAIADSDCTLIVEGVYCTHPDIRHWYDVLIWVDADRSLRLDRGVARDGEIARSRWENTWMPVEHRYRGEHRPDKEAHLVLDSTEASGAGAPSFLVVGGEWSVSGVPDC